MPSRSDNPNRVHIVGTGSYALEVLEYARACGRDVPALVELLDPARIGTEIHGLPVIAPGDRPGGDDDLAILGVGGDRLEPWDLLSTHGWRAAPPLVHPAAHVSPSATVAVGAIIGPGVVIGAATVVGPHALIGRGALVGHHVALAEGVILNPGANVGGNTRVGRGAQIGMGATVVNGTTVGARAVVAAGATVVRPVDAGARVQGVPARPFTVTAARLP